MMSFRNPFAVRNGGIILIEDLTENERGLNCNCQCPACGGEFIARMGDIKAHHFAHSKDACDEIVAYTTGLYKLIHQILSNRTAFYIPPLVVSCQVPHNKEITKETIAQYVRVVGETHDVHNQVVVSKGKTISFDNAELSYNSKGHIQAIELSYKDRRMAIKIEPPDTVCKYATVSSHKDMATLVLSFAGDADIIQTSKCEEFQKYLVSENLCKYWISNPLKETIYPALLKKNKTDYAAYLERQKRIEEERIAAAVQAEERRKATLERQKQLDAENEAAEIERQKQIAAEREIARQKAISEKKERDALAYESVKDKFTQQTERIVDCYGNRWIQCVICGQIKKESAFWTYGGPNEINLGKCSACGKKRRD